MPADSTVLAGIGHNVRMQGKASNVRFCPACACEGLVTAGEKRWECPACGFSYYHNVAASSAAILRCGNEILLCKRVRPPYHGFYDLPGGFQDPGESLEAGLARELNEELGLEVDPEQMRYLFSYPNLYPYEGIVYASSDAYFEVRFENKPLVTGADDVEDPVWVPVDAVDFRRIAFASTKEALERYRKTED